MSPNQTLRMPPRLDWMVARGLEPGWSDAKWGRESGSRETQESSVSGEPGSRETQESSVSGEPSWRERPCCMRVESSGARSPHMPRQPINFSARPCCSRAGNQMLGLCMEAAWPARACLAGCDAGYLIREPIRPQEVRAGCATVLGSEGLFLSPRKSYYL